MKAVINEKETDVRFPLLMKSVVSGNIVLFTSQAKGTIIFLGPENKGYDLGEFSSDFLLSNFTPFTGSITLSND